MTRTQLPGTEQKPCWKRIPPECPVRVPVSLRVDWAGKVVEVKLGWLEGDDASARATICGVELEAVHKADIADACADVLKQMVNRIVIALQVSDLLRSGIVTPAGYKDSPA